MYERSYYDGNLPFHQRTDIQTAHTELTGALQRVRNRIDAEYGPQNWTDIETLDSVRFGYCKDGDNEGKYDIRFQGLTFDIPQEDFKYLTDMVTEELKPLGFTEVVDISDEKAGWVDIYNTEDGGYVGITMTYPKGVFSMSYNTGCRPEATVPSAAPPS